VIFGVLSDAFFHGVIMEVNFPVVTFCPGWGSTGFCWCSDKASEEQKRNPGKIIHRNGEKI
jgi:hypothetical protein